MWKMNFMNCIDKNEIINGEKIAVTQYYNIVQYNVAVLKRNVKQI